MALPPIKGEKMMEFISSRYEGDTLAVASFLSDDFIYEHTPYVGLGIETHYVDGAHIITSIINDSLQTDLNIGDRIHEFNGSIVDSTGLEINGAVGEMQKIILTKSGDSTFSHIETPLAIYQYEQGKESFLESIVGYSEVWYDYDISFEYARNLLDSELGIQGNMDPKIFYQEIDEIENYLKSLIDFGSKNTDWIFNLGHGFRPDIDHIKVKYVVEWIKNANWKR